jgi:hypothetical protein
MATSTTRRSAGGSGGSGSSTTTGGDVGSRYRGILSDALINRRVVEAVDTVMRGA